MISQIGRENKFSADFSLMQRMHALHHAAGLFQRGTCLRHDQLVVNAFLLQELDVRAALGYLAVVND